MLARIIKTKVCVWLRQKTQSQALIIYAKTNFKNNIIVHMHVLKMSTATQECIQETQHPKMCQLVNNFIFKTFYSLKVFSKVLTFKKANCCN